MIPYSLYTKYARVMENGTVLANTVVLSRYVRIFCLPVRGAPGECYYNTIMLYYNTIMLRRLFTQRPICSVKLKHHSVIIQKPSPSQSAAGLPF